MKQNYNITNYIKSITQINFLPRWIVLLLDVLMVFLSFMIINYLIEGVIAGFKNKEYLFECVLFTLVNIFYFWRFKVYSGIIRHSTFIDLRKIILSQFSTSLTIFLLNTFYFLLYDVKFYLTTHIALVFVLSTLFLLLLRLFVKTFFLFSKRYISNCAQKGLIIYGVDERAVSLAMSIKNDPESQYVVKGFINPTVTKSISSLLNLPVYGQKDKPYVIARKLGAEAILYLSNSTSIKEKVKEVRTNIDYNIQVLFLPEITDYNDHKKISSSIRNFKIQDLLERKEITIHNEKIAEDVTHETILVTGAAGSIGSEIVRQLLKYNPKRLIVLDQAETPLHNISLELEKIKADTEIVYAIADIRRKDELEHIFKTYQPKIVYHAAAYKHVPLMENNPIQAVNTNIIGTMNLAELAMRYSLKKFVMISTDKAVNPSNVMGASKRIAEKYVQSLSSKIEHTTQFITTRFGNVLGSNGSVVPLFTQQIEAGGPITITHPDIIRYFMTIPEACQLVLEAGTMGKGGEIFIFDMGEPVKIIDLAKKMIQLAGLKLDEDIEIKVVGLRPGEKLYEELLYDTATTLPTHHEKIMISKDQNETFEVISKEVENLRIFANQNNVIEVVKNMKKITPEFVSLNSEYSLLDKKNV